MTPTSVSVSTSSAPRSTTAKSKLQVQDSALHLESTITANKPAMPRSSSAESSDSDALRHEPPPPAKINGSSSTAATKPSRSAPPPEPRSPLLTPSDLDSDVDLDLPPLTPGDAKRAAAGKRVDAGIWMKPRPEGFTFSLVRWPLLILIGLILTVELMLYAGVRQFVVFYELLFVWTGKRRKLRSALFSARSLAEWSKAASELDAHFGRAAWRAIAKSGEYDYKLIRAINTKLRKFRTGGAPTSPGAASTSISVQFSEPELDSSSCNEAGSPVARAPPAGPTTVFNLPKLADLCLESACKPGVGGIVNQRLYAHCYLGTKRLVEDYVSETVDALNALADAPIDPSSTKTAWASLDAKHKFFKDAAQLYGRTALCLSGGATFAYHHLGVIKALFDAGMLPQVISGTSAGSLIAGIICTRRDNELHDILHPQVYEHLTACDDPWPRRIHRLLTEGYLFSKERWQTKMEWATCGDLTFLEAYEKTGRILNISVVTYGRRSHQKVLNYMTSPHIVVWSAILASSAIPAVIAPVQLMIKRKDRVTGESFIEPFTGWGDKFQDGSMQRDIPLRALHQMWNVNFTIVSQVNPHITAFFFQAKGGSGSPTAHRGGRGWRGGFLASTLEHMIKLDLAKWLKVVRDLCLLPPLLNQDWSSIWLQKFDGSVTILPKVDLVDYLRILDDPSYERMQSYITRGQASTWSKFSMIQNRLKVEQALMAIDKRLNP
ncbi:acyl transferase/acyl hydrolase/lysophospholipase, partial [Catenaria anguillulae PL171]